MRTGERLYVCNILGRVTFHVSSFGALSHIVWCESVCIWFPITKHRCESSQYMPNNVTDENHSKDVCVQDGCLRLIRGNAIVKIKTDELCVETLFVEAKHCVRCYTTECNLLLTYRSRPCQLTEQWQVARIREMAATCKFTCIAHKEGKNIILGTRRMRSHTIIGIESFVCQLESNF